MTDEPEGEPEDEGWEPYDGCERGCERIRPGDVECRDCGAEVQPEDEDWPPPRRSK